MNVIDYAKKGAAEVLMLMVGPLHFTGEMVGPMGNTSLKQWFHAIAGTLVWAAGIWLVVQ